MVANRGRDGKLILTGNCISDVADCLPENTCVRSVVWQLLLNTFKTSQNFAFWEVGSIEDLSLLLSEKSNWENVALMIYDLIVH